MMNTVQAAPARRCGPDPVPLAGYPRALPLRGAPRPACVPTPDASRQDGDPLRHTG